MFPDVINLGMLLEPFFIGLAPVIGLLEEIAFESLLHKDGLMDWDAVVVSSAGVCHALDLSFLCRPPAVAAAIAEGYRTFLAYYLDDLPHGVHHQAYGRSSAQSLVAL